MSQFNIALSPLLPTPLLLMLAFRVATARDISTKAVSYTHLTLPTILLV